MPNSPDVISSRYGRSETTMNPVVCLTAMKSFSDMAVRYSTTNPEHSLRDFKRALDLMILDNGGNLADHANNVSGLPDVDTNAQWIHRLYAAKRFCTYTGSNRGYNREGVKPYFLVMCAASLDNTVDMSSVEDRTKQLVEALYQIQRGNNINGVDGDHANPTDNGLDDANICPTGSRNKMIEMFIGLHPDAFMVANVEDNISTLAQKKFPIKAVKEYCREQGKSLEYIVERWDDFEQWGQEKPEEHAEFVSIFKMKMLTYYIQEYRYLTEFKLDYGQPSIDILKPRLATGNNTQHSYFHILDGCLGNGAIEYLNLYFPESLGNEYDDYPEREVTTTVDNVSELSSFYWDRVRDKLVADGIDIDEITRLEDLFFTQGEKNYDSMKKFYQLFHGANENLSVDSSLSLSDCVDNAFEAIGIENANFTSRQRVTSFDLDSFSRNMQSSLNARLSEITRAMQRTSAASSPDATNRRVYGTRDFSNTNDSSPYRYTSSTESSSTLSQSFIPSRNGVISLGPNGSPAPESSTPSFAAGMRVAARRQRVQALGRRE